MRYIDYLFAWTILVTAIVFIVSTETTHPPGAILDIPFLWIIIAMMNFLRLRNPHLSVRGLRTSCIGANLIGLTMEAVRFRLWGVPLLERWGPYTLIAGVAVFGEVILSILQRNDSTSPARV